MKIIKKDGFEAESIVKAEIQNIFRRENIEILFFPTARIYPKGLSNVEIVSTIYDLQHEHHPQNFSKDELAYKKYNYKYAVEQADKIIAISNYTKLDIIKKYSINADKIHVTYLSGGKYNKKDTVNSTFGIKLPKQFIFYPAALWVHKNHKILIEALNNLKSKFPNLYLVFTGLIKDKKLKDEIDTIIMNYSLSEKVLFLGYVSEEVLDAIYQNAQAMIFPSMFEGFGIPILEAFMRGLPVAAANNTSLTEVVGDAGLLFETNDTESCIRAIEKILSDVKLRKKLIKLGLERAREYSWKNTAKNTLEIINNL